jgi:hypothetical protein
MNNQPFLTNQELLSELKERLPNFTPEEFLHFIMLFAPYQESIIKLLQKRSPKVYDMVRKGQTELEREKIDKVLKKTSQKLKQSIK